MSIYDLKVTKQDGSELSLADYKGKVMLIVNTATGCGFTPHYEPLEALYKECHEAGLEIIDVPCNQFMEQAPGSDEEITQFCQLNYGTTFPQMKKSDVNGENAIPLFEYLKSQQGFKGLGEGADEMEGFLRSLDPDFDKNDDIKWNFTKFVVDKEGNVVARFEPTQDMAEVAACVKSLLA